MKAKNSDILFLAKVFAFYFLFNCNAQASEIFVSEMCNAYNIVAGNGGKAFAAFAVISVGIGFFTGKVSWGFAAWCFSWCGFNFWCSFNRCGN